MRVEVLGNVQDGGIPHLGCDCETCEEAREDANSQHYVSSLLVKENGHEDTVRYLIEATPDIRFQIKGDYLDGVFLSQGHLGHIGGLPFFGTEGLDSDMLSVFCCPDVSNYIMKNDPHRLMVDKGQIEPHELGDGEEIDVQGGSIQARAIEHRHVNTDTTTFMLHGEDKKLYYISDTDRLTDDIKESIREADIAIVDGTFWSDDEIDRYEEVPHPTIQDTMEEFEDSDTDIYFTHLNHTNPALRKDSKERQELEERGFNVAEKGQEFEI